MTNQHSSIQPDPEVGQYLSQSCKYYYLPLLNDVQFPELLVDSLGASHLEGDRSLHGIKSSLIKAQKGQFSHVKVPFDQPRHKLIIYTLQQAQKMAIPCVLQIPISLLGNDQYYQLLVSCSQAYEVEWLVDQTSSLIEERLQQVKVKSSHFSIIIHRQLDWSKLLPESIVSLTQRFHLYFPYTNQQNHYLYCHEINKLMSCLKKKWPEHRFLPPKGVDLWDQRVQEGLDLEPYIKPCFYTERPQSQIRCSVIIPTYNNQNHLRVTIGHLLKQNIGLEHFEIIVVDDGGTDQTQPLVIEMIKAWPEKVNFKYIYFARSQQRTMGDKQYRAGIARNLGVKNSLGETLCFLDSDIIVPSDYLRKVELELGEADATQAKRMNLSQAASSLDFDYSQVDPSVDCIPDEAYWEEFIKIKDWHLKPHNWKYVCTHSFSLKKDLFWSLGGLKRNFIYYGFEDTDLGYRIVKAGKKLKLIDVQVFHMFHEDTRSEFMNLKSLRHSLLSRTAQIFYRHHLDEDIYQDLINFMRPEPSFKRLLLASLSLLSLAFLWKASDPVMRSVKD